MPQPQLSQNRLNVKAYAEFSLTLGASQNQFFAAVRLALENAFDVSRNFQQRSRWPAFTAPHGDDRDKIQCDVQSSLAGINYSGSKTYRRMTSISSFRLTGFERCSLHPAEIDFPTSSFKA
jgi:hypothetical protein